MNETLPTIAIIGGGASGVIAAANLLRATDGRANIVLIECRRELGRGLAYSTREPDHLLNVRAANMSAYADSPDHFIDWLTQNGPALGVNSPHPEAFVPRRVYGEYLASLLREDNPEGLRVIRDECIGIAENASSICLTLASYGELEVDIAIIATGNDLRTAKLFDTPMVSAWTPWAFDNIEPNSTVLLLGTGLTMADVVLLLNRTTHRGKIIAISRHGLPPQAHKAVTRRPLPATEVPFGMPISWLTRWLRALAVRCEAEGLDWRSAVDGIRPHTVALWRAMTIQQRQRFIRHVRSWWDSHRHRMAPEVSRTIDDLREDGRLDISAGRVVGAVCTDGKTVISLRGRGSEGIEVVDVDLVIDCTGLPNDITRSSNPMIQALFAADLARTDPLGIGLDLTDEGLLIRADGQASTRVFGIGPIARGAFWEMIAIPDIRNHCATVTRRIVNQLGLDIAE